MYWDPDSAVLDFLSVADLAGVALRDDDLLVGKLPAPHKPPTSLRGGMMAVYVFSLGDETLKVGKAGPKSQARYTSQHYNPDSAPSTLAASMLADSDFNLRKAEVGDFIKANADRVNILLPARYGMATLTLLEAFLQCRLRPKYEGFKSQRL